MSWCRCHCDPILAGTSGVHRKYKLRQKGAGLSKVDFGGDCIVHKYDTVLYWSLREFFARHGMTLNLSTDISMAKFYFGAQTPHFVLIFRGCLIPSLGSSGQCSCPQHQLSSEQFSKPLLVDDFRGLYYPIYCGL